MTRESVEYWDGHQVASFPLDVSADESLAGLNWRNAQYPGLLELMPVAGFEGKTVIDFGCGPGHDTIGFLMNDVHHVYAVDSSWNGLSFTRARLRAHGFEDRCTLVYVGEGEWRLPQASHIHAAGVIHHLEDPVDTLRKLSYSLYDSQGEIRMMVYDAESQYVANCGGPDGFEVIADGDAPIAKAWTRKEVKQIAAKADLEAKYLGGYLMAETQGPGLGGCWSLRPMGKGWG